MILSNFEKTTNEDSLKPGRLYITNFSCYLYANNQLTNLINWIPKSSMVIFLGQIRHWKNGTASIHIIFEDKIGWIYSEYNHDKFIF